MSINLNEILDITKEVFDKDKSQKTHTYTSSHSDFDHNGLNKRVKLVGTSKKEYTVHNGNYENQTSKITLKLAKDSLDPMLQRLNELVKTLRSKASNHNPEYETVANKMNDMRNKITLHMNGLTGDLIDYSEMLDALRASQTILQEAQNEGEFAKHRGFERHCPILHELCVCLDLIVNFFDFLDKKIGKTISGDQTHVFENMKAFTCGMFKPIRTVSACKVDELKTDIEWYIGKINDEYNRA